MEEFYDFDKVINANLFSVVTDVFSLPRNLNDLIDEWVARGQGGEQLATLRPDVLRGLRAILGRMLRFYQFVHGDPSNPSETPQMVAAQRAEIAAQFTKLGVDVDAFTTRFITLRDALRTARDADTSTLLKLRNAVLTLKATLPTRPANIAIENYLNRQTPTDW